MDGLRVQGLQVGIVKVYDYTKSEAEIGLEMPLSVGDRIHIIGWYTDFIQLVEAIRLGDRQTDRGRSGEKVRVPVKYHVREGDAIVLLPPREGDEDHVDGHGLGLWGHRRP